MHFNPDQNAIILAEFLHVHLIRLSVLIRLSDLITYSPCSAVGSESDCRSRGHEFDPGPVSYFRGDWSWNKVPYFHSDWSWNIFYGHSPSSTDLRRANVSYNGKYLHEVLVNGLVKLAEKKSVVRLTDRKEQQQKHDIQNTTKVK